MLYSTNQTLIPTLTMTMTTGTSADKLLGQTVGNKELKLN